MRGYFTDDRAGWLIEFVVATLRARGQAKAPHRRYATPPRRRAVWMCSESAGARTRDLGLVHDHSYKFTFHYTGSLSRWNVSTRVNFDVNPYPCARNPRAIPRVPSLAIKNSGIQAHPIRRGPMHNTHAPPVP